jgi:hypothetical protein
MSLKLADTSTCGYKDTMYILLILGVNSHNRKLVGKFGSKLYGTVTTYMSLNSLKPEKHLRV